MVSAMRIHKSRAKRTLLFSSQFSPFTLINIVTLRRGIRDIDGCTYTLCPDVRVYRCLTSLRVAMLRVVGISKGNTTTVDCHRIA